MCVCIYSLYIYIYTSVNLVANQLNCLCPLVRWRWCVMFIFLFEGKSWSWRKFLIGNGWLFKSCQDTTGWWFGTFFIFPYIGNNNPNWLIFFRGVETTNQLIMHHHFNICAENSWRLFLLHARKEVKTALDRSWVPPGKKKKRQIWGWQQLWLY